jgi:hypothetical protein
VDMRFIFVFLLLTVDMRFIFVFLLLTVDMESHVHC